MTNNSANLSIVLISTVLPLLATASSLTPSVWKLVKNPTGTGLSLCACLSSAFSMFGWLIYSMHQDLTVSAVSAALFVPYSVAMLYFCVRRNGERDSLKPAFALFSGVVLAALLGGATAVAFVLGLATLAELPQLRSALRGQVPALSILAYGLTVLRTLPWLPYAIAHRDLALMLWITTCGTVNAAMFVALLLTRRARASRVAEPALALNDVALSAALDGVAVGAFGALTPGVVLSSEETDSEIEAEIDEFTSQRS